MSISKKYFRKKWAGRDGQNAGTFAFSEKKRVQKCGQIGGPQIWGHRFGVTILLASAARGYGGLGEEDNAIKYLRDAFKYKANLTEGVRLPDPMTDASFEKFHKSEKFRKAVAEMRSQD